MIDEISKTFELVSKKTQLILKQGKGFDRPRCSGDVVDGPQYKWQSVKARLVKPVMAGKMRVGLMSISSCGELHSLHGSDLAQCESRCFSDIILREILQESYIAFGSLVFPLVSVD